MMTVASRQAPAPPANRISYNVTPTPGTPRLGREDTRARREPEPEETQVERTAPPPAGQGTPAAEPRGYIGYLSQFQGRPDLGEEGCSYNPSTRVTDCGVRGIYSVRPPLGGQDISCFITIVGRQPGVYSLLER